VVEERFEVKANCRTTRSTGPEKPVTSFAKAQNPRRSFLASHRWRYVGWLPLYAFRGRIMHMEVIL